MSRKITHVTPIPRGAVSPEVQDEHAFRDPVYFWAALLLQARHGMEKYGSISSVWVKGVGF